jgi:prepilin-type N-terminal cleavage/methylation domain-containing protein
MKGKVSMKIRKSNRAGFTLVEIMIVVALIGLLATIATPTWVRARTTSQANTCINNLRQIEGAKQQWALETKQATNAIPLFTDLSGYLKNVVTCPAGGNGATFGSSYTINDAGTKPVCRISPATHLLPPDTSQ